jgi:4-hydroxyphenylpyruvate dioxygenase
MSKINRINDGVTTDRFESSGFDHLEFYCLDAKSVMRSLKVGLGFEIVSTSMHETGNHIYASYVLRTGIMKWVVTAPYLADKSHPKMDCPHPDFKPDFVKEWVNKHGNGVAVIGIEVKDAKKAFEQATGVGEPADSGEWAKPHVSPMKVEKEGVEGYCIISEVFVYGDTIVRFIQKEGFKGEFLPGYKDAKDEYPLNYGLRRQDHVVGNVWNMDEAVNNIKKWFGYHTFAKFSKEDIQTEWTSLNSEVLSNNDSTVLLPINEPVKHKRQSQIEEYLIANNGPGVQHIALFTNEVLDTIGQMRKVSHMGGFEFIPTPSEYYKDEEIIKRMDKYLTPEAQKTAIEYGLLLDEDDEGCLLQIFTKPLFDRPTLFVEIIQRICKGEVVDKPGCGGFGKGNFRALFQSIERMQAQREMLLEDDEEPATA